MEELSLNVLDIAQNSTAAGAKRIRIHVEERVSEDQLTITVSDDGHGMQKEFLSRVTDPFVTTRQTRKVGLGIPLLKMTAEMAGGSFNIQSEPGKGTCVRAAFRLSHIDRPPIGNMAETITTILQGNPNIFLRYQRTTDAGSFLMDSEEIIDLLGNVPLNEPEVLLWIREYIEENESEIATHSGA